MADTASLPHEEVHEHEEVDQAAELADGEQTAVHEGSAEGDEFRQNGENVEEVEPHVEEQPWEAPELVVSSQHENFTLDKKEDHDQTIGLINNRNILCQFCHLLLIPEANAVKVNKNVHLI